MNQGRSSKKNEKVEGPGPSTSTNMELKKKKKIKPELLTVAPTGALENWQRCTFWLIQRQRLCRMSRVVGGDRCAEHLEGEKSNGRERIPCPLDPTHSCFKHLVRKHVKKCNSAPPAITPPYVQLDVNLGVNVGAKSMTQCTSTCTEKTLGKMTKKEYYDIIGALARLHSSDAADIQTKILDIFHLSDSGGPTRGANEKKHLLQVGAILGLLEEARLFMDNVAYIEYGSGRGGLTFHLARALKDRGIKNSKFYLIDKSSPRYKMENKLGAPSETNIIRIRADIKDIKIDELPGIREMKGIVGFAKHLCGSATDMALYSLVDKNSNSLVDKVLGFCFATCCHHRCDWNTYMGTPLLQNIFCSCEFEALKQMSSWAVDGSIGKRIDDNECMPDEYRKLLADMAETYPDVKERLYEKKRMGEMIKDVLDALRIMRISKDRGFVRRAFYFADPSTTLENRVIMATSR